MNNLKKEELSNLGATFKAIEKILDIVFLIFVILQLCGAIDFNFLLFVSPFLAKYCLRVSFLLISFLLVVIFEDYEESYFKKIN